MSTPENRSNSRIVFVEGWKRGESLRSEDIGNDGGFDRLAQLTRELQDEDTRVVLWNNQPDGYDWKAYGSNKRPLRSGVMKKTDYFKCCNFDSTGSSCDARKTVQQNDEDSRTSIVVYQGKHNHEAPHPEVLEEMPVLKNLFHIPFDAGMTLKLIEIRDAVRGPNNPHAPHSEPFQPLDSNRDHPNPSPYYNPRPRKRAKKTPRTAPAPPRRPPAFPGLAPQQTTSPKPAQQQQQATTSSTTTPSRPRGWVGVEASPLEQFVHPAGQVPAILESTPPANFTKPDHMAKSMFAPQLLCPQSGTNQTRPTTVAPKGSLGDQRPPTTSWLSSLASLLHQQP